MVIQRIFINGWLVNLYNMKKNINIVAGSLFVLSIIGLLTYTLPLLSGSVFTVSAFTLLMTNINPK